MRECLKGEPCKKWKWHPRYGENNNMFKNPSIMDLMKRLSKMFNVEDFVDGDCLLSTVWAVKCLVLKIAISAIVILRRMM